MKEKDKVVQEEKLAEESKPRKKVIVEEVIDKPGSQEVTSPEKEKKIEAPIPIQPLPTPPHFPILWIIIPGILILIALVGGVFVYQKGVSREKESPVEPTPTSLSTSEATATPEPKEVDLTKHTIRILNGSGIKGEAGKVKEILEKAGFKVGSTGNAKTYNYEKTVIQAKEDVEEEFISELRVALEKSYVVQAKIEKLSSGQTSQVEIIVGSSKP